MPRRMCLHDHVRWRLREPKPVEGTDSYRILCPSHDDAEHSASISVGEHQRVVWYCFAGCDPLAMRAGFIGDGIRPECLPVGKHENGELIDQITKLCDSEIGNADFRLRIFSLVKGYGGDLPPKGKYPGGRRRFAADAGVSKTELYRFHR